VVKAIEAVNECGEYEGDRGREREEILEGDLAHNMKPVNIVGVMRKERWPQQ
jgi:hypothetical protein